MHPISNTSFRFATAAIFAAATLCGCEAREMGVNFADAQANSVDNTRLTAAKTCWPDLGHQGYSTGGLKRYLVDPLHFRAAFSGYSSLSDSELRSLITKPVQSAPPPDTSMLAHSSTPVFTRAQALAGTDPRDAIASNTNGATPPGAFCAAQPGTPVGFR